MGAWDVRLGPCRVGVVNSYDEAINVLKTLAGLAERLPNEPPITDIAEMYFDLQGDRDRALEHLELVVEKWVQAGRCEWCPAV